MKRLLSILLATALLLSVVPSQVFAEGAPEGAPGKPVLTVKFMEIKVHDDSKEEEYVEHEVAFTDKSAELGMQTTVANTSSGQIRGRGFMGWTNVKKSEFSESNSNRLYSANNTVADVLAGENIDEGGTVTLYAYYDGVVAINMGPLPIPNNNVDKHKYVFIHDDLNKGNAIGNLFNKDEGDIRVKSVEENPRSNVQKNSWGDDLSNFAEGDRGSVLRDKTITSYYHPTIEDARINFQSSFNMHKGIALLVRNNGSWALSGSEVKLEVRIPEGMELEDTLLDVEFDSHTFRIKGVEATDKDNKKIAATIENNSLSVEKNTFDISFESGKGKDVRNLKLIVEPKKRASWQNPVDNQEAINEGMDALKATDVVKEMHWNGKSAAHFSKAKAKELVENQGSINLDGSVYGQILFSLNGQNYPLGIRELKSNIVTFKFVYPEVTFVKNTQALGDSAEQELAKVKAKQEDDKGTKLFIGDEDFPKDPTFTKDGKEVKFLGWNTKPDGNGDTFTSETDVREDMRVYAIWEKKEEPKPEPKPDTGHKGGSKGGATTTPSKPEPKPEEPDNGDLNKDDHYQYLIGYPDGTFAPNRGMTRAEVATMFTRLLKDRPVKGQTYAAGLSDIYAGDWYANTVGYAVQKGIVSGYPDGTFKPNQPITRAEFSSIASRFADLTEEKDLTFSDLDASHWGYKAIRLAASNGWISGYPDNTFRPEQAITRAEVTSITNRMLNRYADLDWINAHNDAVIHFSDVSAGDWFFEPVMEATMGHDFTRDKDGKAEKWTGLNEKTFI